MLIVGQAYEKCTACSEKVIKLVKFFLDMAHFILTFVTFQVTDGYDKNHLDFIKKVLHDPLYLEEITGLAAMKAESEAMLLQDDWADLEDEDF